MRTYGAFAQLCFGAKRLYLSYGRQTYLAYHKKERKTSHLLKKRAQVKYLCSENDLDIGKATKAWK